MRFPGLSGLLVIATITFCEEEVQALGKPVKSGGTNDLPKEGEEWMLHTPGGGPLDSRCPCLPSDICPRAFGHSPMDVLLLGHLPICMDESKVRCCGASLSITTGFVSTEVNEPPLGKVDITGHINYPKNTALGVPKDSNDYTQSPPPKEQENLFDIVEMTEESPTTFNALQAIEDQTVRTMYNAYGDEPVNITPPTNENGTGTLTNNNHSLNQNESSDMVYIENWRPDEILFHDTQGITQETEDGSIMVVTPIPLTPRAKYQHQLSTGGKSQLPTESESSYIHTKDVMYVTHRPEGEVMVITPLSLPPDVETSNFNSPSQEERPEVEHTFRQREHLENRTHVEGFTKDIRPLLSSEMLLEETRENNFTGIDLKPVGLENQSILQNKSTSQTGSTTTITGSNIEDVPKEIHQVMAVVNTTQKFTSYQRNVGKGFGVSQIIVRNPTRPTKTRVLARPTWSPKRIRTRKPENLGSGHSPQQGTNLESITSFLRPENSQYLSTINKPVSTRSIGAMVQDNGNVNPILQDSPSTTSVKYVPVAVNEIGKLKLQPMLTSLSPVRIPDTLVVRQHAQIVGQTPLHGMANQNNQGRIFGAKVEMNEEFTKRDLDEQEILRRKQEMDSLHQELSSLQSGLRQWLVKNAELAQSKRVNNENQPALSSHVKIGHHPSQQFYTHDNLHINKYSDEIFGRKILPHQ